MPELPDHDALEQARGELRQAAGERAALVSALAASRERLAGLQSARGGEDPATREETGVYRRTLDALVEARSGLRDAKAALAERLSAFLPPDPAEEVATLDARLPVALFPVRLETRFVRQPGEGDQAGELLVRIYPDAILADLHEPLLSQAEVQAGRAYWDRVWRDAGERDAWTVLLTEADPPRAAWIVLQTQPTNLDEFPSEPGGATAPVFDDPPTRPPNWSATPEARALPDRWLVHAYRGGELVSRAVTAPVLEPLSLTLSASADGDEDGLLDEAALSEDGLEIDAGVLWTFDFGEAERVGMATRLPLTVADFDGGFDQVVVLGVKSSLLPEPSARWLAELFDSHHYSRGLAFVAQGTPTNNLPGAPSGYPPPDPGGARSFAVERGALLAAEGRDGARFMRALGLPRSVADHLDGADRDEQSAAAAMADALWPATIGYFMEQLLAPELAPDAIAATKRHLLGHVRARGPYPAFRTGAVPYGLLPASSLSGWQPDPEAQGLPRHLPALLLRLRPIWAEQAGAVPRVGRGDDPDADLLGVLGMEASAREARIRTVLGYETVANMGGVLGVDLASWEASQREFGGALLGVLGLPGRDPRILWLNHADEAYPFAHPLVADPPLSETERLALNYVAWVRTATVEELRGESFPEGVARPTALLYAMLRHAHLAECARAANSILVRRRLLPERHLREAELVSVTRDGLDRPTIWRRFDQQVSGITGDGTLAAYLSRHRVDELVPETADLAAYRASLRVLEELPSAELERVFTETLDLCSHRLDAWITSLATERLERMRAANSEGVHLGAYGWVEDLRPDPPERRPEVALPDGRTLPVLRDSGGYVYAPSMAHGAAAAVLRNAYLTRGGEEQARYAVNLSSARVRAALELLDAVRQEQPLGAVLGYRFERALHEGHPGLPLDRFIDEFRALYPQVAGKTGDSGEPAAAVAARNVVDGLALRAAWREERVPWGAGGLTPTGTERAAIEDDLRALDDAVDAVTDLLSAESVFQAVRGGTAGAGATLDTMAKGVRPPEPEIARVPRGGTSLSQRVVLVLGGDPLPGGAWADPPRTPRGRAERALNAWVGTLLGDPATVRCVASFPDPAGGAGRVSRPVTLEQLALEPLDVLALAAATGAEPADAELDRRIAWVAAGDAAEGATIQIDYDVAGLGPGERGFPELLEVARSIGQALAGTRPLRPVDLLPPERERDAASADLLPDELADRAAAAIDELDGVIDDLGDALATVEGAPAGTDPDLNALRGTLLAASLFGLTGSIPASRKGSGAALRGILLAQATSVLAELRTRQDAATAAGVDPATALGAVFGRGFLVVPRFVPPAPAELARALAGPDLGPDPASAVGDWTAAAARVRPALGSWRTVALYARATGAPTGPVDVVQLPHVDGARWAALRFARPEDRPRPGLVSLVLHRPSRPAADAPWAGLLLDEWVELIPSAEEDAGVVLHYDRPGAEAPQAVLLAVPPAPAEHWNLDALVDTLLETLELAKVRAVDSELLGVLGQALPMAYLAANPDNDTVSTRLVDDRVTETRIALT